MATLDDVRSIAIHLPGSVERATTGGASWCVRNKPFAWECHPWPSMPEEIRELCAAELVVGVRWSGPVASAPSRARIRCGYPDAVSIHRGTVTNNLDPALLGRLQVLVPSVTGDVLSWASPVLPLGASLPNAEIPVGAAV